MIPARAELLLTYLLNSGSCMKRTLCRAEQLLHLDDSFLTWPINRSVRIKSLVYAAETAKTCSAERRQQTTDGPAVSILRKEENGKKKKQDEFKTQSREMRCRRTVTCSAL